MRIDEPYFLSALDDVSVDGLGSFLESGLVSSFEFGLVSDMVSDFESDFVFALDNVLDFL